MKRLIILLLVICSTVCDLKSCEEETDTTKCSTHALDGIDGYSCRLYHSPSYGSEEEDYNENCEIFPDSAEDQKIFWRISHGGTKEVLSINKAYIRNYLDEETIEEP